MSTYAEGVREALEAEGFISELMSDFLVISSVRGTAELWFSFKPDHAKCGVWIDDEHYGDMRITTMRGDTKAVAEQIITLIEAFK